VHKGDSTRLVNSGRKALGGREDDEERGSDVATVSTATTTAVKSRGSKKRGDEDGDFFALTRSSKMGGGERERGKKPTDGLFAGGLRVMRISG